MSLCAYFVLPYVVNSDNTIPPLSLEVASIICLAESERKKKGILRKDSERIKFVSKTYYPIFAIPWNGRSIILDSLDLSYSKFIYSKIPDIMHFTEDLERYSSSTESFKEELKTYIEKFSEYPKEESFTVKFIFNNEAFLIDMQKYLTQGNMLNSSPPSFIPSATTETERRKEAKVFTSQYEKILDDLNALKYALNMLRKKSILHKQKLQKEIKFMKIRHETRLSTAKLEIDENIAKLTKEHEMKLAKLSETTVKQLKDNAKKTEPLERKLEHLLELEESCLKRISSLKNKEKEAPQKRKLENIRSRISDVKNSLSSLKKQAALIKKQEETNLKALKNEYDMLVGKEFEKIESMKSYFNSEVKSKRIEIEDLKKDAFSLNDRIRVLMDDEKRDKNKLYDSTISLSLADGAQICVPIYVVVYETGEKYRYHICAPIIIGDAKGLIESLQKKFLGFGSRMKLFFKLRSKNLDAHISQNLLKLLNVSSFEREIFEACSNSNILNSPDIRDILINGLDEFKNRDWISTEEIDNVVNASLGGI